MSTPFRFTTSDGRVYSGRSAALGEAADGAPLVIALHGGTYTSEYFDIPGYSLLDRAAARGIPIIALDRPNYVDSSPLEAEDSIILANADVLSDAIGEIWEQYGDGTAGIVLIAHSIGAAVATAIAATQPSWPLRGLAISGCLVRVPQESRAAWESLPPIPMIELPVPMKDQVMFGPEGTFTDDMPAASHPSNTLVPKAELLDITGGWIARRAEVCGRVTVPVFHRQGEFDHLWVTDQNEIDEFRAGFGSAASVDSALEPGSGHCIDFHVPAERFQQAELDFAMAVAAARV
ncbi:alpha/beta fold hydrolase [Microbacterium luticocti]|uniref:alpha/beta fold hydrolase n=1 Tax=Microbacterium luticocti TaxID=451764 RepID=UPI0004223A4B|nr:alpha/beta hydrolase [Microbacterium luticocti]